MVRGGIKREIELGLCAARGEELRVVRENEGCDCVWVERQEMQTIRCLECDVSKLLAPVYHVERRCTTLLTVSIITTSHGDLP
jgi:hypothetical protein